MKQMEQTDGKGKAVLCCIGILLWGTIHAGEHYARVEPIERSTIKAAAAGQIVRADLSREGRKVDDAVVVQIDDRLDRADLQRSLQMRELTRQSLELTRQMLPGLEESWRRQKGYYKRIKGVASTSQTQKDQAYSAMTAARNQYLSTKEKVLSLQRQLLDLEYKIVSLRDLIAKKSLHLKERYLYRLLVRPGEYAAPGTPLAIVDDLSRGKLTLYLSPEEKRSADRLSIWIDGKKSDLHFAKIWQETDDKYLSSYRAEIYLPPRYPFSSLHKVELK